MRFHTLLLVVVFFLAPRIGLAQTISDRALQQIAALEQEKEARTPAQKKMDSQLIYAGHKLVHGVASSAAPEMEPDIKIHPDGRVLVDITATVSDDVLKFITQGNGEIINQIPQYNAIRALMPIGKIEALAARGDVHFVARAHEAQTNIGSVTGEGDVCHRAAQARVAFGVDGTGVRVGVLSDSADYYTNSQALGDLGPVNILPGQGFTSGGSRTGEGTAMMEIIHDLAPGASLYFATAFGSQASFAANINALAASNCNIIVDDVSYFVESPFQDGQSIAQAVKNASDAGVLYFSSARNSGNKDSGTSGTWEGDFSDGGAAGSPLPTGRVHNFGGGTNYNAVTFVDSPRVDLFWSDPLGGSANDYDLYILNAAGTSVFRSSTTIQNGSQDPYESISTNILGGRIVILQKTGAAARFLHIDTGRGEIAINTAGNVRGHNSSSASNAFCVAAVDVHASSPFPSPFVGGANNPVETFSSDGPRRIFYLPNGTAITPGNVSSTGGLVLQKPDITAADGASGSAAVPNFSPFYGTSAAAPHAAGIAALLKSFKPLLTPSQMRAALTNSALDIMAAGYDRDSGPGITMALQDLASVSGKAWLLGETAQISGGNGNGTIDSNECNNLQIIVQNIGNATASNITAVLSSSTPGVSIALPNATYPNVVVGGTGTNTALFAVTAGAGFVCGAPISFTLTLSYAGGVNTNTFTLPTCQCPATQIIGGLSNSDPTEPARLGRDGISSGCGAPKTCPGSLASGAVAYDAYSFTNSSSVSVCVSVSLTSACGANSNVFSAAYLGSFVPASVCSNYLGDMGNSVGPGTLSYSFTVPANTNFTVIVNAITTGFFCPNYTLNVSGLICPGDGGGACSITGDLALTKTAAPDPVTVGSPLTYSLAVTNRGNTAVSSVTVTDTLPASVSFVSATSGCTTNPVGVVICGLGTLAGNTSTNLAIIVVPQAPGTIINTAIVTSATSDPIPANNTATATTTVSPAVFSLNITKAGAGSGSVTSAPPGINCGVTCVANFNSNTIVTLTAASSANSTFTGWSGGCTGTGNCVITMNGNLAATATFNAAPIVTGASITGGFSDEPIAVTGVTTFDGDGDSVSLAYQWQFSTNGTSFADQGGATNATLLAGSDKLWRCRLTPSDAFNTGTNFLTGAVAVNNRPNQLGRTGQTYSYDSDLFFAGGSIFIRNAIINEFSQGGNQNKEWIELLLLKTTDLRGWFLSDGATAGIKFGTAALWSNVVAGSLLVVYNGADRDTTLPPDNTNPASNVFIVASSSNTFFTGTWGTLVNSGDSIILRDSLSNIVHALSYATNSFTTPQLGTVGANTFAAYTNDTETGVTTNINWKISNPASGATPGVGNSPSNSNFVAALLSGAFGAPQFRFGAGGDTVPGPTIDATSGLVNGLINSPTGGLYNVVIERFLGTNVVSQQYTLLVGDSNNVYRIPAGKTWTLNNNYTIPGTLVVTGLVDTAGRTLVVSNALDVSGGTVSNATGLIIYHKLIGGPLPGASLQFNTAPTISAASISPVAATTTNDLLVTVTSASDADGDPVTFAYQWQYSTDDMTFSNLTGQTATMLGTALTIAGDYYRASIIPNDGISNGAPFTTTSVALPADADGNGINDDWEVANFGHIGVDPSADVDGDGLSNLKEYLAGTDPNDASSLPLITSVQVVGNDIVVSFATVSGKQYELQRTADIVNPTWVVVETNIAGTGGTVQKTDTGAASLPDSIYRVQVLP